MEILSRAPLHPTPISCFPLCHRCALGDSWVQLIVLCQELLLGVSFLLFSLVVLTPVSPPQLLQTGTVLDSPEFRGAPVQDGTPQREDLNGGGEGPRMLASTLLAFVPNNSRISGMSSTFITSLELHPCAPPTELSPVRWSHVRKASLSKQHSQCRKELVFSCGFKTG